MTLGITTGAWFLLRYIAEFDPTHCAVFVKLHPAKSHRGFAFRIYMKQGSAEFNIKPNAAFRHKSWPWLLLLLVVVSLGSALRFAWLGYWMILPFSLLELTLLIWVMETVKRNANYVEKIIINGDKLEIHHLEKGKNKDWRFPLYWVRMNLVKPSHPWYPHKLQLGASGKWVEIGQCLTEEERFNLADAIGDELEQFKSTDEMNHA